MKYDDSFHPVDSRKEYHQILFLQETEITYTRCYGIKNQKGKKNACDIIPEMCFRNNVQISEIRNFDEKNALLKKMSEMLRKMEFFFPTSFHFDRKNASLCTFYRCASTIYVLELNK